MLTYERCLLLAMLSAMYRFFAGIHVFTSTALLHIQKAVHRVFGGVRLVHECDWPEAHYRQSFFTQSVNDMCLSLSESAM